MPRALRAIGTKKPVQTGQMRKKGVEPIHPNREQEPESCASTNTGSRALYVAIAPYELGGALSAKPIRDACSYAIARKRPIRSAIALSPAAIRALARSMSLSLHTSSGGGSSRCCRRQNLLRVRWRAVRKRTNAKKSSKEPPVVRVPSCTYSHALHIQSQAPSSLRRPSPVLTTK